MLDAPLVALDSGSLAGCASAGAQTSNASPAASSRPARPEVCMITHLSCIDAGRTRSKLVVKVW